MTTGYVVTSRGDLDALFKARVSAAIANTGFLSNGGVDLAQRFEPRSVTAAIANTGFTKSGTDLAQLFMGINAYGMFAKTTSPQVGYSDGIAAVAIPGGTFTPNTKGPYQINELSYSNTLSNALFALSDPTTAPPNTDATFQRIELTGIFSDSGSSATKTLLRSAAGTSTGAGGGRQFRQWAWSPITYRVLDGNTYAISFF